MKKTICLLLFLLLLVLFGCNKKTTIESEEEWKALFDSSNYKQVTVEQKSNNEEYGYALDFIKDENTIMISMMFDDVTNVFYLDTDNEYSYLNTYMQVAEDTYYSYEDEASSDEIKEEFINNVNAFLFYDDFSDQYENITYNEEKKCYCFEYNLYDSYAFDVEVYVANGLIEKIVILVEDGEEIICAYKHNTGEIKLPTIKTDVENASKWKDLFSENKFENCSSYVYGDDYDISVYIADNMLEIYEYNSLDEEPIDTIYINNPETNQEKVLIEKDGTYIEEIVTYNASNQGIHNFKDRIKAYTIGEDYSNDYDSLTKVDDHYVLEKDNKNIEFYISGNYIYKMIIKDLATNNIETRELYDYGLSSVYDPREMDFDAE